MAIDVTAQMEILKSRQDVAAYAFEPSNDPAWIGGIWKAELLTERPVGTGAQVQRLARFLGREINYILEVGEFEPDHLMVMQSVKGPFPMKVTYRIDEAGGDKALASIRVEGRPWGFYQMADTLTGLMVRNSITNDLKRLKKIMETGG